MIEAVGREELVLGTLATTGAEPGVLGALLRRDPGATQRHDRRILGVGLELVATDAAGRGLDGQDMTAGR